MPPNVLEEPWGGHGGGERTVTAQKQHFFVLQNPSLLPEWVTGSFLSI